MTAEKLAGFYQAGVNRINIGVQSFSDFFLGFLSRIHTAKEAIDSFESARSAGFDNIGLDLIYGLPGQTERMWQADLQAAIDLRPEHLSCYMLTYEPGTRMERNLRNNIFRPLSDKTVGQLYEFTVQYLEDNGYCQYEVSNFSTSHQTRSRHNQKYWTHAPYIGLGPSAHSFMENQRSWNVRSLEVYLDKTGQVEAVIDSALVTKWKTAGDSLWAALRLARPDSRRILIVGAGTVGRSLRQAYGAAFPQADFTVWNRTKANADVMAAEFPGMKVAEDLETAVRAADIITSATMSTDPVLKGDWLQPGQHVDLIGAYRPDMREADDTAIRRARVFVDNFGTTIGHIGEIEIPLKNGVIQRDHLLADYYDLDAFKRQSEDDITLFKNGGGAHLDLMTARYILDRWRAAQ